VVAVTNGEYQELMRFLGERFAQIDGRFAQIDGRFAQIDGRFAQIDGQFAQIGGRFAQINGRLAEVDGQFAAVRREIREQADTLAHFRAEVRSEFDEVKGLLRVSHGDLDRRVRRLEEGH
jgi:ABC-type transporter Mla subunit MlaD